jgi:hypothetical protein
MPDPTKPPRRFPPPWTNRRQARCRLRQDFVSRITSRTVGWNYFVATTRVMRIIELHPPTNYSWLYTGLAVNTRGRRYKFQTTVGGVTGVAVREVTGSTFWRQVTVPPALKLAARKAVQAAQRTARRQERGRGLPR